MLFIYHVCPDIGGKCSSFIRPALRTYCAPRQRVGVQRWVRRGWEVLRVRRQMWKLYSQCTTKSAPLRTIL